MLYYICKFLQVPIPNEIIPHIITAIGVTNSVISFVLTNVLQRPSMVHWRTFAWFTFTVLWISVIFFFLDLLGFGTVSHFSVNSIGTKLGLTFWGFGLLSLIILVYRIFSVPFLDRFFSKFSTFFTWKKVNPFDIDDIPDFGVPFFDMMVNANATSNKKLYFPILVFSDRTSPGLQICQRIFSEGLKGSGGGIYLSFTRPWTIVAKQIFNLKNEIEDTNGSGHPTNIQDNNWTSNFIILDCYKTLYLPKEKHDFGSPPQGSENIDTRFCDPRDPTKVEDEVRKALWSLQKKGVEKVRLFYDSLSDFLAVADEELVVSYLRRSIVWEELNGIMSLYLVWPDLIRKPISDKYLVWFGNTVLKINDKKTYYEAELEGLEGRPIPCKFDQDLAKIP